MPNIAAVFKEETSRIARKEVRAETASLKKASTTQRGELADLKRRLQALEREVTILRKAHAKAAPPTAARAPAQEASKTRFSHKGLASHRARLKLSAEACAQLLGVSGQTVYNWEAGKSKPRTAQMASITAFRGMGKREAVARLASIV